MVRNTLYEGLQDHELVQSYPDVRGMVKNLFFVTHNHKENGGMDDTASKYNSYEVRIQSVSCTTKGLTSGIQGRNDPRPRALPPPVGFLLIFARLLVLILFLDKVATPRRAILSSCVPIWVNLPDSEMPWVARSQS